MVDSVEIGLALVCRAGWWLVSRRAPGRACAGMWEFPGGKREPDESPSEAAVRETREETGLTVEAIREVGRVEADGPMVFHLVLCRPVTGEARPASAEVTEVRWVSLAELKQLPMPPANAEMVRRIEALGEAEAG